MKKIFLVAVVMFFSVPGVTFAGGTATLSPSSYTLVSQDGILNNNLDFASGGSTAFLYDPSGTCIGTVRPLGASSNPGPANGTDASGHTEVPAPICRAA